MACIILYKGEEIPYAEWVSRLEKGLLDKLINDETIDIAQFKGEFTPIEKKEEVKKEEVETPKISKQPTSQAEVKNKLIELGISEEEAEVSSRIYDAYVRNKAAKTGRTIEDVYGDIEFEGGIEGEGLNQIIGEQGASRLENAEMVLADLNVAREMEKAGKTPKEIYLATSWERGSDKKWKFEIVDIKNLNKAVFNKSKKETVSLYDLVGDNEIFKAYPELKKIKVKSGKESFFNAADNTIILSDLFTSLSAKSTLIHELQHAIQFIEGFAFGTTGGREMMSARAYYTNFVVQKVFKENKEYRDLYIKADALPYYINDSLEKNKEREELDNRLQDIIDDYVKKNPIDENKLKEIAKKLYHSNKGEIEARNAQARMNMSEAARKAKMLSETEDISREQQIVLRDGLFQVEGLNQVDAYHGSPYSFDRFSTDKMGTGEGVQVVAYGLYFSDSQDVAKYYAKNGYKYKVSIEDNNFLEWNKPLTTNQIDQIKKAIPFYKKGIVNDIKSRNNGGSAYNILSYHLGGDKQASNFLAKIGINGIKYPTSFADNSKKGFSYVVFDENAVSIKERSLFQKEKSTPKGRITFTDLKSIMAIGKKGDASTFIHELSHHDLQGYIDAAKKGDEKAINSLKSVIRSTYPKISETEVNKKLAEVLKIDRTQENVRGTEYEKIHEHYARGFEKWMKDGDKAGFSAEMVALFEKMKEFLTRIYEGLKLSPIDVQFSPEVEQMYRDMFGVEYFGITEQLEELRNDIQQDNIENVGDVSMDDILDGLLQRGLQQDPKPRLTVEESLIKMAEIMFKNFETDEINVINDIKAKINGLQTTEERKQEILAYLTPKMVERLKEEVAFANTNLRQLALKIIQSESATDEMKKQARKNAYYEKMDLQKERDKAEKRAGKNITELENDTNKLVKLVSKDNNVGAELVNDLVSTFQRVNAQYESAKARGDKDMIEKTEAMASDLLDALFNQSTTAGKTLAAQKVLKFVIPDMYVKWIEKKVNLRNSETAVKDLKEKLKEALKNMRALEANESWALEVQDKLENKIESLQDVIAQQNQDIERLQKLKAEVEAEEKKPQERATTEPNLNKKGIIEQAKGSEYVNKLKEEMLRRARERGLMQDINEMPDSLLLTELATEYIIDQIKNGKKVSVQKLYNFLKDVHFSDTKIDDILSTYQSIKESLKGETSVSNFSTQTEIDEYRDKLLQVKELNGKIREKEMSEEELAIKKAEEKRKKDEERVSEAPLSVAKRIIGEAERRNAIRTPKEQDAIKKLKEILFKRAVDRFKEKPFKERVEKSIEEKLADFLNEELLANGKDWDVEIKKEIDSMIDNAKYSDEDKAMMREFISDYLADRTETLLTNAVADDVLKKVLSEGYPTKDGKVDWHTIIKKNYKNQEGARQYLVEKLGERIGSEKLANDVIEALEKRFQKQVSQRKEKYLEAEIRRLEKLKENEKLPQRVNSRIKKLIELDNIGGLDEDIFYSYMAKELGMDALTPEDLTVVKKFITLIQSTPEGEEKNNLMRTLSAFISMRVSPKAFTIKSMVEFKLSNMLAHPITSLVNATAGFSQPIMMFKRFLTTGDTNYLKIYFDSFNKGVFKAAFQSGYLKSGMNYESAGGDKLATFSNLEEFEKISKYMDSKAAKLINKLFIGGANLRIPYLIPSLKQYGRFNEGVDSIVRTQAEEMRAYRVIQDKIIRDNKKNGTTMTTKEVRELAWQKLYPISTKDAIAQAVQEFADSGVVPTDAMVKRRAFEIQQQMRDDDVRELAEKEGLRDTYRTPPKLNADEIEGIFDAINFVFGAITRGFTKPQKGEIGITGKQVAYQAVKANLIPFVNTVMNLLETGSNFVPVYGAAKAALSGVRAGTVKERGGLSQEERREEYARLAKTQITQNLIGTALSMFLLQMLFDSLNEGLGDDDDEYGIYGSKPYGSKKTNDKTTKVPLRNVVHLPWADIPINAFGVLAPYLYFEAAMSDLKRSIKVSEMNTKSLDEVTRTYLFFNKFPELAGLWLSTMMKNMPLAAPRAFGDMIGKATSGEGSATSRVGEFAGSALKMQSLPQSRALQDAYEAINPTTPEATNFAEGLAKGGGFITQMMFETKPMYDYRGRTIDIKDKHLLTISGFIRRFGDANKSDEIDKFVTKHKLFVNPANSGKETDKYQEAGGSILTHTPYTSEEIYDSYYAINIRFNMALQEGKKKMEEKYKYEDENGKNVKEEYTKYNLEGLENIYNKWYEANKKSGMSEMSAKAYADREVQKAYSEMYNGIEKQYFIEYKEAKVSTPAEYLRLLNVKDPFK